MSQPTAASIKAILNESTSETSSLVAGTIYDCNQDPVLNARARVKDSSGAILSDARDYYFNDASLPTRRSNRSYTNTDGRGRIQPSRRTGDHRGLW